MSGEDATPKLSVVVISFNGAALLERCLMSLERQTLREEVEILVVGHWDAADDENERLQCRFPKGQWIRAPEEHNVPQMRSLGIKHSRGEIVALQEDDCVVDEAWCATIISSHLAPCAAVGGAVEPGKYTKRLDWAVYFSEYGRFMQPLSEKNVRALPGTNVSYKRAALADVFAGSEQKDNTIENGGFYEVFVHQALQEAGLALKADPALVVYNVNSWTLSSVLRSRFHHGRGFAGMRIAGRPRLARLPFLGLAVFLPIIQTGRIVRQVIARKRYVGRLVQAFPWFVLLAMSWSVGEFVGYLLGPAGSPNHWR